jgi:hypothetical protein
MSTQVNSAAGEAARARGIWIASLASALIAFAFLYGAQPSHALTVGPLPAVNLPESLDEPFEELEEAGECEVLEQEAEDAEVPFEDECGEFEEEAEGSTSAPPSECLIRTVSARVLALTKRDRVSLVLGYTSFSPADVTVDYRLKGSKGALNLGRTTHHFSRQGVFRLTEKLSESQMAKVEAAKDFAVRIRIPSAPGYCRSFFTHHLNVKRKAPGQVVWRQEA